jgi:hypothetical protein
VKRYFSVPASLVKGACAGTEFASVVAHW